MLCLCAQSIAATFAAMIGSGIVVRSMPYTEGVGGKQLAWMVHAGIMGAVVAPLCLLGGPIITRAACYTAGVVGGMVEVEKEALVFVYSAVWCLFCMTSDRQTLLF